MTTDDISIAIHSEVLKRCGTECAICFKPIDIKDYYIQLCRECRRNLKA
jgi:hypothetical protein